MVQDYKPNIYFYLFMININSSNNNDSDNNNDDNYDDISLNNQNDSIINNSDNNGDDNLGGALCVPAKKLLLHKSLICFMYMAAHPGELEMY